VSTASKPVHRIARRAFRGVGLEEKAQRVHERYRVLRGGPTVWRNHRDDERVRLVAAAALREDSNCIDVGANEGLLLQQFAELAPRGRHIAYEPVPALAEALERRFPAVEVRRAAASDGVGETSFVVHKELASRSSLRSVGYPSELTETLTVRTEDLDSSLPDGYVPHLLKVDVEGAEQLVLRGAIGTLTAHRPLVLFEHQKSTASHYGSGPEEMFALLAGEAGMRIFDMDGAGPYTLERFSEAYETGSRWNFVAVPSP
jgi:FkbM family methyltransferase